MMSPVQRAALFVCLIVFPSGCGTSDDSVVPVNGPTGDAALESSQAADAPLDDASLHDTQDAAPDATQANDAMPDAAVDAFDATQANDAMPDAAVDAAADPIDQAIAALPSTCSPLTPAEPACANGAQYDHDTGCCVLGDDAFGPFPQYLRDACSAEGGGAACTTDQWNRDFLLRLQDTTDLTGRTLDEVLDEIRARPWVYCQPTAQDLEGNGIFEVDDVPVAGGRSEESYLPFVLGPRRQTDSMVRALYLTLPLSFRAEHAFVIADRLLQNPEAYVRYVRSRSGTTISGSFMGIGQSTSAADWVAARHGDEMWKLRTSIMLVHALGRSVDDVVYAMGDSSTSFGLSMRQGLEARMHRILSAAGIATQDKPLGWGADETTAIALSRHLPTWQVRLYMENPNAQHHYDGMRTTAEILSEKMPVLRLQEVGPGSPPPEIEIAVLTRRPGGSADDYQAGDAEQAALDDAFLSQFDGFDAARRSRLVIIDARIFNGAWDKRSALPHCDYLAFGSWGTFGNVVGSTLAAARLLHVYGTPATRRQLYLEAVAHDVFANGYAEAQRGELRDQVNAQLGAGAFSHWAGYHDVPTTKAVFDILNALVSPKMQSHFAGADCVDGRTYRFTPQLWRTFESEVHTWPADSDEVFTPGVYRTDLPADTFDPTGGRSEHVWLQDLIEEAAP